MSARAENIVLGTCREWDAGAGRNKIVLWRIRCRLGAGLRGCRCVRRCTDCMGQPDIDGLNQQSRSYLGFRREMNGASAEKASRYLRRRSAQTQRHGQYRVRRMEGRAGSYKAILA